MSNGGGIASLLPYGSLAGRGLVEVLGVVDLNAEVPRTYDIVVKKMSSECGGNGLMM